MFDSEMPNQLKTNGRKGSRRGTNTVTTRNLGKAARADKPTERVEMRGIEQVEERERGVKLGGTGAMSRRTGRTSS